MLVLHLYTWCQACVTLGRGMAWDAFAGKTKQNNLVSLTLDGMLLLGLFSSAC